LLKFLAERPGRVFSREQLLSALGRYRYAGGNTAPSTSTVRRLRAKLGAGSANETPETVRHVGIQAAPRPRQPRALALVSVLPRPLNASRIR